MTAEIDYIPYATGGGAEVMSQANYITDAPDGVSDGLADPTFANKAWRQSSMFAAALANIISTQLGGINVIDDGNLTTLITNLTAALETLGASGVGLGFNASTNLQIGASVGSNQLTVSILGTNGSAPSATNPVTIPFRDSTIANGELVPVTVTAVSTVVLASGNTAGTSNGVPFRLWVVAFNNAGTAVLGIINCSNPTQIFPINEDAPQTSLVPGNSAGVYYTTSAVAAKSIRILGYMEWASGLTTAGTWATGPTKIQLFGPGQRKPGEVVQALYCATTTTTTSNGATKVNLSGFSPSPTITITAAMNLVRARLVGNAANVSGTSTGTVNLFRGTNATTIGTTGAAPVPAVNSQSAAIICEAVDAPGAAGATTYGGYVLGTTTGMVWLGSASQGVGGTGLLTLEEIMG
jgi:hypothetical protein